MFAAIFYVDGRPVDQTRFGTAGLDVESPDQVSQVAFVCSNADSHLASGESIGIRGLGGQYRIVGRVRLDARGELRSLLSPHARGPMGEVSDGELCLRAYAAWGDTFLEHLAGDFCFVLWDEPRRRLICARDQLGIRSLFHAEVGGVWFVSDSLDWIAAHSAVSRDLDDTWIADFLTVGYSLDPERTVYRHIRRLAPAHALTISGTRAAIRRYWRLEIGDPLYYRDRRQYTEGFVDLLSKSIADRLPPGRVGIAMSGGLDSTTLAACAVKVTGDTSRVVAESLHFERFASAGERELSSLVAGRLGIELRHRPGDDLAYDARWWARSMTTPEPSDLIATAHLDRQVVCERAERASVWFHGEGPDNALIFERDAYLSWLAGQRDWMRLAAAGLFYLRIKGLAGWWETLARFGGRRHSDEAFIGVPPWIEPSLVRRLDLERRVGEARRPGGVGADRAPRHPWRPRAVASFNDPIWPAVFADYELEESLGPIVLRHPFLDLRVLEFMLSVPTLPWTREKLLLREAMRGRLPHEVLARRKVPNESTLPFGDGLPALSRNRSLDRYVNVSLVSAGNLSDRLRARALAVHVLDHWLARRHPGGIHHS
ncbi:MAG: asparagine synthase-related protein [Reyranella sp.]